MGDARLIEVDFDKCQRLARILASAAIPADREDLPVHGPEGAEVGNYYLLLVAICHQTQTLEGFVDDRHCRGWDYLSQKLSQAARQDREALNPNRWLSVSGESLRILFEDERHGQTLSDPEGRAELIRDLGAVMQRQGWKRLDDLYELARRRIATGSPTLLELLANFQAYSDPVRKKSLFLLGLMANTGQWSYVDEEELGPPVDYHEVRGHLRVGTVIIRDPALRNKLLRGEAVSETEDVAIRQAVYDAIVYLSRLPDMPAPMARHYLFWNVFRSVCRRENPYCRAGPPDCGLPERYRHLLRLAGAFSNRRMSMKPGSDTPAA